MKGGSLFEGPAEGLLPDGHVFQWDLHISPSHYSAPQQERGHEGVPGAAAAKDLVLLAAVEALNAAEAADGPVGAAAGEAGAQRAPTRHLPRPRQAHAPSCTQSPLPFSVHRSTGSYYLPRACHPGQPGWRARRRRARRAAAFAGLGALGLGDVGESVGDSRRGPGRSGNRCACCWARRGP